MEQVKKNICASDFSRIYTAQFNLVNSVHVVCIPKAERVEEKFRAFTLVEVVLLHSVKILSNMAYYGLYINEKQDLT